MNPWTTTFQAINILLLFLAIGSGIYVWYNARKLGMNQWLWALLTIALFPIGLIGYMLYRYLKLKGNNAY